MYQFENLLSMSSFKASEKVIFFFFTLCCLHIFSEFFKRYAFGASEMTQQVRGLPPKLLLLTAVNKKVESQKLCPDISTRSILHQVIKV